MRKAFSIAEMLLVVAILGIIAAISAPKIAMIVRHQRVNKAASIIVVDLQNVFAMAGRMRAPVHLASNSSTETYTFSDRKTGTIITTRSLGSTSEYRMTTLVFNPTAVDMFPNGIGSSALTVTVGDGDYSRTITASTAGFVRLVP